MARALPLILVAATLLATPATAPPVPLGCPGGEPGGLLMTFQGDTITAGGSATHQYAKDDFVDWIVVDGSVDFYVDADDDYTVAPPANAWGPWVELGGSTGRAAMMASLPTTLPEGSYEFSIGFAGSHALPANLDAIDVWIVEGAVGGRPTEPPRATTVRDVLDGYSFVTFVVHFHEPTTFSLAVGLTDFEGGDDHGALFAGAMIGCRSDTPPTVEFAWHACGMRVAFRKVLPELADSWLWDLGDGARHVAHWFEYDYFRTGFYDVTLTIKSGPWTVRKTHTIEVLAHCPEGRSGGTHSQSDPPHGGGPPRDGYEAAHGEGDQDQDGIADRVDSCPYAEDHGRDSDGDGVDDACDAAAIPSAEESGCGDDCRPPALAEPCQSCEASTSGRSRAEALRETPGMEVLAAPETNAVAPVGALALVMLAALVILRARR